MASFDVADYDRAIRLLDSRHQRIDRAPTLRQKLGPFTVVCLVLNRTIGSGIFVTPVKVLNGTGSIGVSLLFWSLGGLVAICGLLVWLELGLSVPLRFIPGSTEKRSVPRSGGEKNYLEFIYTNPRNGRPRFLVTCMYGIGFILVGNLSGNAIAFGSYVMSAAGQEQPSRAHVIGLAIAALTTAILLHVCSRRGGILVNNAFAILKVLLLLAIIILGFIKASGARLDGAPKAIANFDLDTAFVTNRHDVPSYTNSLLYIAYTYSGFEQPFYVLSEVRNPRKVFPRYTIMALILAVVLFTLVNIAYFCAVPKDLPGLASADNIAIVFFSQMFENKAAKRVMAAIIAISIFGNILVMTFTASRVKQEIAKEGILPFSLFFATSHTTPFARWASKLRKSTNTNEHLEQTPMAALGLHWVTSIILIAATSMLDPGTSYSVLVSLYSYTIIILNGFFVSVGLVYLYFARTRHWRSYSNFSPWLAPMHAMIYGTYCLFLLICAFLAPAAGSPYEYKQSHIRWYIIPAIGLSAVIWGVIWFFGLHAVMRIRGRVLIVTRVPFIVPTEDGGDQWVQSSELVDHEWHTHLRGDGISMKSFEVTDHSHQNAL